MFDLLGQTKVFNYGNRVGGGENPALAAARNFARRSGQRPPAMPSWSSHSQRRKRGSEVGYLRFPKAK